MRVVKTNQTPIPAIRVPKIVNAMNNPDFQPQ